MTLLHFVDVWSTLISDCLAARLETERDGEFSMYASLCYVCSGSVEKMVENWYRNTDASNSSMALQVRAGYQNRTRHSNSLVPEI